MDHPLIAPDERTLDAYLTALRSAQPTPGGGSASAYCGALGASLGAMVCRLTISRAREDVSADLRNMADSFDQIVDRLSQAARNDELCFTRYQAATRLPKATEEEARIRKEARQEALRLAAEAPLGAAELAVRALGALPVVARIGTHHAISDVEVALALLLASIDGSLINAQVNVDMITDHAIANGLARRSEQLRVSADDSAAQIREALADRVSRQTLRP